MTHLAGLLIASLLFLTAAPSAAAVFADVLNTPAQASPLAKHGLITGLAVAGTRAVAVGQRGHILFSDDLGKTWTQASVPVSADLTAVYFVSSKLGWAVGHDGVILHSNDAGASWTLQLKGPEHSFLDVWFEDEGHGFAAGAFNWLFRTEDGGKTWTSWEERTDNPKGFHLNALRPVGGELYIVGEQGLALKLNRAKQRFEALQTPYKGSFFGVTGNAKVVVAFGLRGNAVRSTDAGKTWSKVDTGLPMGLTCATVTQDGAIVVLSQAGHVLVSRDDGASFIQQTYAKPGSSAAVAATGSNLLIGGARGLRVQPLNGK